MLPKVRKWFPPVVDWLDKNFSPAVTRVTRCLFCNLKHCISIVFYDLHRSIGKILSIIKCRRPLRKESYRRALSAALRLRKPLGESHDPAALLKKRF